MELKSGDLIGGWTLVEPLDEGGTSDVWKAKRGELECALKILRDRRDDRYKRFQLEAEFGSKAKPGTLPVLEFSVPDPPKKKEQAWIAMPIAEPIDRKLGKRPSLNDVISAIHAISVTLASLAVDGIHHRDIKPANLFYYDGNWCLGDFGLIVFPDKEKFTEKGRGLGPRGFIPDEVYQDPDRCDPGPVDIYELAKTLWVLAKGQNFPPQGPLELSNTRDLLRTEFPGARAEQLDLLLERATRRDPGARPTMEQFAVELDAWLTPQPAHQVLGGGSRDAELASMVKALAAPDDARAKENERINGVVRAIEKRVEAACGGIEARLSKILEHPTRTVLRHGPAPNAPSPPPGAPTAGDCRFFGRRSSPGSNKNLIGGITFWVYGDGLLYLTASYRCLDGPDVAEVIWSAHRRAHPGSAEQSRALEELIEELDKELIPAVERFVQILSGSKS